MDGEVSSSPYIYMKGATTGGRFPWRKHSRPPTRSVHLAGATIARNVTIRLRGGEESRVEKHLGIGEIEGLGKTPLSDGLQLGHGLTLPRFEWGSDCSFTYPTTVHRTGSMPRSLWRASRQASFRS